MNKFDTHGGYFAPTGYFKVNTGGSHDENPNGGVQIGVDQQGVPNMLEEGEPVYNDYVFSDNIKADEDILAKYNIPAKYAGKLYSEIADAYVDEAEERPLDPISNNGLNEMLVRLSQAQEEQKQIQQRQELEDELASMSPEELAQLDSILAGSEQSEIAFADGGVIRKYDEGTPGNVEPVPGSGYGGGSRGRTPSVLELALGSDNKAVQALNAYKDWKESSAVGKALDFLAPEDAMGLLASGPAVMRKASKAALSAEEAARLSGKLSDWRSYEKKALDMLEAAKKQTSKEAAQAMKAEAKFKLKTARTEISKLQKQLKPASIVDATAEAVENVAENVQQTLETAKPISKVRRAATAVGLTSLAGGIGTGAAYLWRPSEAAQRQREQMRVDADIEGFEQIPVDSLKLIPVIEDEEDTVTYADGGMINRFDNGGWENFLASLADYKNSLKKGRITGTYAIDSGFPLAGYKTIKDLENSEGYQNFTNYIIDHSDEQKVQDYLKALDAGVAKGVTTLFDGDTLRKGWEDIFRRRRNDGKGGIYHFSGDDLNALNHFVTPTLPSIENKMTLPLGASSIAPQTMLANPHLASPIGKYVSRTSEYDDEQEPDSTEEPQVSAQYPLQPYLATFPRYAGALMNGALGVYNALQEPDRYSIRRYNPVLPSGRMQLVDPVYNPIDENMAVNDVLANSAATSRAIANSGLGPSTGAALLAADYNAGRNIGAARTQVWDANNQRRNNVIAQRNANGQALGNFNYGISRDRAQIINDARLRNIQNEFAQQRMNYAAEGEKYAALGNQISNINAALYGIGTENVRLNSISSNPAYDWVRMPDGNIYYMLKRNSGSNGGVLLKKYNK